MTKLNLIFIGLVLIGVLYGKCSHAEPLRIAVIDSGLPAEHNFNICPNGEIDLTGTGITDKMNHGSLISSIIADKLEGKDYCFVILKIYDVKREVSINLYLTALFYLNVMQKVDIVNYSSNGPLSLDTEKIMLNGLIVKGTKFITAAGNNSSNMDIKCNSYPMCYSGGIIGVGNGIDKEHKSTHSNWGSIVKVWRNGDYKGITGTSTSAAQYSADLALEMLRNRK